jgi:hypothetical protein
LNFTPFIDLAAEFTRGKLNNSGIIEPLRESIVL